MECDIGARSVSISDESEKYIKYDLMAKLYTMEERMKANNLTVAKPEYEDESKRSFFNIVTKSDEIFYVPMTCLYRSRGFLNKSTGYTFVPKEKKVMSDQKGIADFSVDFFVSDSSDCEGPMASKNADQVREIFMCVLATNISDPSIKFSFNEVSKYPQNHHHS